MASETALFGDLHSSLGDVAQVVLFFAALYIGTPLIGTYGSASLQSLQRRVANCAEALGSNEAPASMNLARNALDDLQIAMDVPLVKDGLSWMVVPAFIHVALALFLEALSHVEISGLLAIVFFVVLGSIYGVVGARGVAGFLSAEAKAIGSVRVLESDCRAVH